MNADRVAFVDVHLPDAVAFNDRWAVLTFALCRIPPEGLVLEFGVHKGESLYRIAGLLPRREVHGFDSFEGLPEAWNGMPAGAFRLSEEERRSLWMPSSVELHKGLFRDTLVPFVLKHPGPVAFAHVDSDLYSSAKEVLDAFFHRLVPGTVLLFDELYGYDGWEEGEFKAFQEFLSRRRLRAEYLAYNRNGEQVAVALRDGP